MASRTLSTQARLRKKQTQDRHTIRHTPAIRVAEQTLIIRTMLAADGIGGSKITALAVQTLHGNNFSANKTWLMLRACLGPTARFIIFLTMAHRPATHPIQRPNKTGFTATKMRSIIFMRAKTKNMKAPPTKTKDHTTQFKIF